MFFYILAGKLLPLKLPDEIKPDVTLKDGNLTFRHCKYNLRGKKGIKREQISSFNVGERLPKKAMKLKVEVLKDAEEYLRCRETVKDEKAEDLIADEIKENKKLDPTLRKVNKLTSSNTTLQIGINQV